MYSSVQEIETRYVSKEILDLETRVDSYTWCYPLHLGNMNALEIWDKNREILYSPKQMTIYIHIPYCKFICEMCPFTHEPLKENKMDEYVDSIIKEIEFYSYHRLSRELQVNTVYFGGGTASLLESHHVKKILNTLYEKFNLKEGIQITLECHPRTV